MIKKRVTHRSCMIRGTTAHALQEYFSNFRISMESDVSLHPILSRFYSGVYTPTDLRVLREHVAKIQGYEKKFNVFDERLKKIYSTLDDGK